MAAFLRFQPFFIHRKLIDCKEAVTMTKELIFRGAATALITPLTETGVDYETLGRLIDWQIEKGINALVIAGTTGEGSTLSDEEHRAVLRYSIERAAGRVPIIAGTGSNDTAYAISLTRYACEVGADAMLVVTPYYNKATQNGLIQMYTAIADASTKPLILYNVPSRTGVSIEPATYAALADHPMIAGIKEANGNISKIVETAALVGDRLAIYSGNDDQIVPILSMGGQGVISVLSNVAPAETAGLCSRWFAGDTAGAAQLQCRYLPLINALFSEVNPIPVKAAMAAMGFGKNILRLPLTPMEPAHEEKLLTELRRAGLL
jgi:4-hydroxy-tetrahydrodipicolinate synthase